MLKGIFSFHSYLFSTLIVLACVGCNHGSTSHGQELHDSVRQSIDGKVQSLQDTLKQRVSTSKDSILKVLSDSIKKPGITAEARQAFKNERKRIKDSLRTALDILPKHVDLTFDDGPL